jgi:hypothetical protein
VNSVKFYRIFQNSSVSTAPSRQISLSARTPCSAMVDGPHDASPVASAGAAASPALRPRREAFEYGLLPIPKLVFPEGTLTQTLSQLKERLAPGGTRLGAAALAEALQIPAEQAALALGTLAAVLPAEDPVLGGDGAGEADLRDLLLSSTSSPISAWCHAPTRTRPPSRTCGRPPPPLTDTSLRSPRSRSGSDRPPHGR